MSYFNLVLFAIPLRKIQTVEKGIKTRKCLYIPLRLPSIYLLVASAQPLITLKMLTFVMPGGGTVGEVFFLSFSEISISSISTHYYGDKKKCIHFRSA